MDAPQFRRRAEKDENLSRYLEQVMQEAAPIVPARTAHVDFLLNLLAVASSSALLLWLKHYAEYQCGLSESELRHALEQEIDRIAAAGFTREQATDAVTAVSNAVATRPPEKFVLQAGLALLSGSDDPTADAEGEGLG
jgi:hypothetical protein